MIRLFILFLLSVFPLSGVAQLTAPKPQQDSLAFVGSVKDKVTRKYLDHYKTYLLTKDSIVVDSSYITYGVESGKNNPWFQYLFTHVGEYILHIIHPDYEEAYVPITLKRHNKYEIATILDPIYLRRKPIRHRTETTEKVTELGEAVARATRVKMIMKGDTIVYDADAFQLAEGSMLDDLIQQLPGAVLKDDGRIYINGEYVESLLLNGKDFLKGNAQTLIENLPAYMVKAIKVYKHDAMKRFTGRERIGHKSLVMDVNLKKKYSIGWLTNAETAIGSQERYLARLFGLRFSPQSRLTLWGNANNTNDTRKPGRTGDWSPTDTPNGVRKTQYAGMDFNIEDKFGRYEFNTGTELKNYSITTDMSRSKVQFLSGGDVFSRATNLQKNWDYALTHYDNFIYSFGKGFHKWVVLEVAPSISHTRATRNVASRSATYSLNPTEQAPGLSLLELWQLPATMAYTTVRQQERNRKDAYSFNGTMKTKAVIQPSRYIDEYINITFSTQYNTNNWKSLDQELFQYPASGLAEKYETRYAKFPNRNFLYNIAGQYFYRWRQFITMGPSYEYSYERKKGNRDVFVPDTVSGIAPPVVRRPGELPSLNNSIRRMYDYEDSFHSIETEKRHKAGLHFDAENVTLTRENQPRVQFRINLPVSFHHRTIDYSIEHHHHAYRQVNDVHFSPDVWFKHTFFNQEKKTSHSYQFSFSSIANLASLFYLIDRQDHYEHLSTTLANPNLHRSRTFSSNIRVNSFSQTKEEYAEIGVSHSVTHNAIGLASVYDRATGHTTYIPTNVAGNWSLHLPFSYERGVGKDNVWHYKTSTAVYFGHSVDLATTVGTGAPIRSGVNNWMMHEGLELRRKVGKNNFSIKGDVTWNRFTSNRTDFNKLSIIDFNYGITALLELPWSLQFSTDMTMYSRRGYINKAMNTNDLVWNARLSKRLMKGNLTLNLDGFDILGQLSNIQRSVNAQGQTETYYNVVPAYVMLRAVFRLNINPQK